MSTKLPNPAETFTYVGQNFKVMELLGHNPVKKQFRIKALRLANNVPLEITIQEDQYFPNETRN